MNIKKPFTSPSLPVIWLSQDPRVDARFFTECDCVCDACFDAGAGCEENDSLAKLEAQIRCGSLAGLARNPEVFTSNRDNYTLALSAAGSRMVVMDSQTGGWFSECPPVMTINSLRDSAPGWTEEAFVRLVSVLVSQGIFTMPGAEPAPPPPVVSGTLNAWLELTNRCNLECRYCYIPHGAGSMTPDLARRAVQAVFRSARLHGYRQVKLKYSGGEPTLNFAALQAASDEARQLSTRVGIACDQVMLTNGVCLTDAQIDHLIERDIRVMISLDGLEESHELNRPARNGQSGSFQKTLQTIDRLLERGLTPHISITITRLSLPGVPELVKLLLEKSLTFSLNLYRPAAPFLQEDPLSCSVTELIAGMERIYQGIDQHLPPYSLWAGLTDRAYPASPHRLPCAAGHQYLVVDHTGHIARCQMEIALPAAHIDDSDPLATLRSAPGGVQNHPVEERECAGCFWRYRCSGGCPRLAQDGARSPLCAVYQQILPKAAHLEARRLVRYQAPLPMTGNFA